ncbi:serine/threonine-protein kinase [Stenotrophomonas sp. HITSZ_GD]|uniref:serine/threonine-protein kinase n=1 Tax=Stenotrophomonas sp. HITSZ_GD TaxID=3037248 RepID=UPI00240DEE0C|nr:serine/threonine-protein kinase [Stenotrophomonas sp. HITSZ_GD]MDG2526191.1 serine/threonine-protein kinase [Stenotrophomonas sp. HITSZ_GD]
MTVPLARQRQRLRELTTDLRTIALVEAMLDRHTRSLQAGAAAPPETELHAGDLLGPWRLVEHLASGGMGTVFLAERADDLYHQRVAIKLLHGTADATIAARMAAERQLLAQLQHPGIARLYDGGTTPGGQPYLVMEYVQGLPLDQYCQAHALDLPARLALFRRICRAVEAAHRHLVVHCDLKPANVLVREDGEPVLLDFGIARALGAGATSADFCTPAYASPELLEGRPISVASDVYSLGVLLVELLADRRVARDAQDPRALLPRPSVLGVAAPWHRRLGGELDAIAGKATAPEPGDRYRAVAALEDDIVRYQQHQRVLAMPGGRLYHARKLLRRRWRETSVATLFAVLAVGFVWRLGDERDRAEYSAATAQQVTELLLNAFKYADPKMGSGHDGATARDVLDAGARQLEQSQVEDRAVHAQLLAVLASAFNNIGQSKRAEPMFQAAVDEFLGPQVRRPDLAAKAISDWSVMLRNDGRNADSVALARRALALRESIKAPPLDMADSYNTLGLALIDTDNDAAGRALHRALALRLKEAGRESLATSSTLHNLGMLAGHNGEYVECEQRYREALAIVRQLGQTFNARMATSLSGLSICVREQGRLREAATLQQDLLALTRQLYGGGSMVGGALGELASTQHDLGDWPQARANYEAAMRESAASDGEDTIDYAIKLNNLASLEEDSGALADAERDFRSSLAIRAANLGPGDIAVLRAKLNLARILLRRGHMDAAGALIEPAFKGWLQLYPAEHPGTLGHRLLRADWWLQAGRVAEASVELADIGRHVDALNPRRLGYWCELNAMLADTDRAHATAVQWRRRALDALAAELGADHVETAKRRLGYAQSLAAAGQGELASAQLEQAARVLLPRLAPEAPQRDTIDRLRQQLAIATPALASTQR